MTSRTTFPKLILSIFMLVLLAAAVTLVPLGIFLTTLPCLFLEFLGSSLLILGLILSVSLLRILRKVLLR